MRCRGETLATDQAPTDSGVGLRPLRLLGRCDLPWQPPPAPGLQDLRRAEPTATNESQPAMESSAFSSHRPECDRCWVRERSVFCDLASDNRGTLESRKITRTFRHGEPLYLEGDTANGVFCIYQGAVKVFRTGSEGHEQIVRLGSAGDLIGYRSVFDGGIHSTCATAIENVRACYIPQTEFALVCETNPAVAHAMFSLLSHQLVEAERRMLEMTQNSVRERVAETLLQIHAIFGVEHDGSTLAIRISRGELAALVGAATESVIRILTELKRAGVLTLRGRRIGVLDIDAVRALANRRVPAIKARHDREARLAQEQPSLRH
jgi:CRP/FNR family transcriptional regulator, polysaccharide utilization system transcription regulator